VIGARDSYLIIDTASHELSVVLKAGGKLSYATETNLRNTSKVLLPSVDMLLSDAGIGLRDLGYLAVTTGPGSFTGLRVGYTTVKAWAYVNKTLCIGINSLQANAYISKGKTISIIDGSNGVAYIGVYDIDKSEILKPACVHTADLGEIISRLPKAKYDIIVDNKIFGCVSTFRLEYPVIVCDSKIALPRATEDYISKNKYGSHESLILEYIRKSQPERGEGDI